MNDQYHISVLRNELVDILEPRSDGIYVDATFGGGGHTRLLLEKYERCRVIAFDWDMTALELNGNPLKEKYGERLTLVWGNFAQLQRLLAKEKIKKIDGVMADFGTSQHQIFEKPGFSFMSDTPLDMRMSPAHYRITAADILNRSSEKELADIFHLYGEEPKARACARIIVQARVQKKIQTTAQLVKILEPVLGGRKGRVTHPATRVFQALRIAVNHELENIEHFLRQTLLVLKPGGIIACISFHSLEDRAVKQFFKEHDRELENVTPGGVTASEEELAQNPSARSARLRAARMRTLIN